MVKQGCLAHGSWEAEENNMLGRKAADTICNIHGHASVTCQECPKLWFVNLLRISLPSQWVKNGQAYHVAITLPDNRNESLYWTSGECVCMNTHSSIFLIAAS